MDRAVGLNRSVEIDERPGRQRVETVDSLQCGRAVYVEAPQLEMMAES